jgi:hypothetical protein
VAGAMVATGEMVPGLAIAPLVGSPSRVDRPMPWDQLILVEDDPGKFDIPFWLKFAPFPADRIDSAIGISRLSFGTSDASEGSLKTRPASSCSSS